jgi:hypothetical protein
VGLRAADAAGVVRESRGTAVALRPGMIDADIDGSSPRVRDGPRERQVRRHHRALAEVAS